jgi:hypothetical protein
MGNGRLWRSAGPSIAFDERSRDRSFVLGGLAVVIIGVEDHDRALMGPKLLAKSRAMSGNASGEALFEVRSVAAQIGWLETCIPVAAANAVANIELFLSLDSPSATSPYIISCGYSRPTSLACSPRGRRPLRSSAYHEEGAER